MKKLTKVIFSTLTCFAILSSTAVYAEAKNTSCNSANSESNKNCVISNFQNDCPQNEYIKLLFSDKLCFKLSKLCDILNYTCPQIVFEYKNSCGTTDPTDCLPSLPSENPETPTNPIVTEPASSETPDVTTEPTESEQPTEPKTEKPTYPEIVTEPATRPTNPSVQRPQQTQPTTAHKTDSNNSQNNFNEEYADEVIRLVNIERVKAGLSPLAKRQDVTEIAEIRAKEITQVFSHTRPNGTSCFTLARERNVSYRSVGENIAYGYNSPQSVVQGWMNSQGHRENILSSSFNGIGVGCYRQGNTLYWTQFFIGA